MNQEEIETAVEKSLADARSRMHGVTDPQKRWNRLEEALETVCEDAIHLLDTVGRFEQGSEISSHLSALERYDVLLQVYTTDTALGAEAQAANLGEKHALSRRMLEAWKPLVTAERKGKPGES